MKKLDFNSGWTFRKAEEPPAARAVTLPHDAMIHEGRSAAAPGGSDNAFFPAERTFTKRPLKRRTLPTARCCLRAYTATPQWL